MSNEIFPKNDIDSVMIVHRKINETITACPSREFNPSRDLVSHRMLAAIVHKRFIETRSIHAFEESKGAAVVIVVDAQKMYNFLLNS